MLLAMMTVSVSIRAAVVDTLWVEVPDSVFVKAQRTIEENKRIDVHEVVFYKIRESNPREAAGLQEAIKRVAEFLQKFSDAKFYITGYADRGTGNPRCNRMYAKRRADRFTKALVDDYGLNPANLITDSKGDVVQPFAENDKNRCVIVTGSGLLMVSRVEDYDSLTFSSRLVPYYRLRPMGREDTVVVVELQPLQTACETIPRREFLAVKSNLLLDVAYVPGYNRWCPIPNVALEYYPLHGHFTYGASLDFPWWRHYHDYKFFELRNYQLESRYYFRSGDVGLNKPGQGAAYRGWYLQGYVHGGLYTFCFNADKGWTGEFLGGGLGFGYVTPLSKNGHWRLEFGAQFGYIYSGYDPFQYEYRGLVDLHDDLYYYDWTLPASQFRKRQYRYSWFGPTRIGVTLSYDLLYRRQAKKGVSFKSYELQERRYEP